MTCSCRLCHEIVMSARPQLLGPESPLAEWALLSQAVGEHLMRFHPDQAKHAAFIGAEVAGYVSFGWFESSDLTIGEWLEKGRRNLLSVLRLEERGDGGATEPTCPKAAGPSPELH